MRLRAAATLAATGFLLLAPLRVDVPPIGPFAGRDGRPAVLGDRALSAQEAPPPSSDLLVYGHADYDWRIRPLDGPTAESTSLSEFRGRVLFINLWASWCRPCVRELGSIERLRERLRDTGVEFLIVAAEGERTARRFLRTYPYELPFYVEEQRIPRAFGLLGIPTTWVVDRKGRIVLLRHGEAVWDTDEVEAFIRRVASPS